MVHLSEKLEQQTQEREFFMLLDPTLLRSARRIYRTYCALHSKLNKRPVGVAINRDNHRGQLIFHPNPILLPGEHFVPMKQLESEIY